MGEIADMVMSLIPDETGASGIQVSQLTIDMPVEIYPRRRAGGLQLDGNAPSQSFVTGFTPVFHRIRVTIAAEPTDVIRLNRTDGS